MERKGRGRPAGELSPARRAELIREIEGNSTGTELGRKLGLSKTYVDNLRRVHKTLKKELFDQLRDGKMSITVATRLAKYKTHAEQEKHWRALKAGTAGRIRSTKDIRRMLEGLVHSTHPHRDVAMSALKWVLFEHPDVLGVRPRSR